VAFPVPSMTDAVIHLTAEQQQAVAAIEHAIEQREAFTLQGLAGSGKTTVAAEIARSQPGAFLCAPTGKAASVLHAKTGLPATTIHGAFYDFVRRKPSKEGEPERLEFRLKHLPGSLRDRVVVLDECSMCGRKIAQEVLSTGITVIAIGDPGQLPPVEGVPFFTTASFNLRQVHRQALENPIIRQAHAVRAGGVYMPDGDAFRVIDRLTEDELNATDIVLTWRRATRSRMNTLARRARGIASPLPQKGEPLVCLRNTPRYGLYNGAIYYASRDLQEGDEKVGISTDAGEIEVYADFHLPGTEDDPLDLPPGGWKTALAFGYAVTVHKSQGSEFDKVLLLDENHSRDRILWLYTGITRAIETITIAKVSIVTADQK
jgi:exodeoxyribonuclease V